MPAPLFRIRRRRRPRWPSAPKFTNLLRRQMRLRESPMENPNGISPSSPRLRGTSYLGSTVQPTHNPNGVVLTVLSGIKAQPRWGWMLSPPSPRVARASQPWAGGLNPFGIEESNCELSRKQQWNSVCRRHGLSLYGEDYERNAPGSLTLPASL